MSRVSAFKIVTREIVLVTLEGNKNVPILVTHDVIRCPTTLKAPEFTDWAETQFGLLLDKEGPDRIVYKLSSGLQKHEQIFRIYFGLGVLNLVAKRKGIPIRHISPNSVRPKAFGLGAGGDIDQHVQLLFGALQPPWNKGVRETAALAILDLD